MCAVWSVRVGQHPQPGPIPAQNLDPCMPPVAEHKERSAPRIFSEALGHRGIQPVEPLAHVAGLHRHKDLQAPGETQHAPAG